jgi:hypothetical protein
MYLSTSSRRFTLESPLSSGLNLVAHKKETRAMRVSFSIHLTAL